jgi:hypothetical protein
MLYVLWIGRVALAAVFALAAASKLRSRGAIDEFVASLSGFGVPARLARAPLALAVAAAEVGAAGCLIAWPRAGGLLAAALLVAFAAAIVRALSRAEPVVCRCFGASRSVVGRGHLARNLVLAVLAAAVAADGVSLAGALAMFETVEAILATAGGLGVGLLVTRWDDLAFIFSPPDLAGRGGRERRSVP